MYRLLLALMISIFSAAAFGQVSFPQLPQPLSVFSDEDRDWKIEPTSTVKPLPYHVPTPTTIPGARVIKTLELKALLDSNKDIVVIDVLWSKERITIPDALWMSTAGDHRFFSAEKSRFSAALEKITNGNKSRPIVFLCLNSECWLSYNASLHALEAGFTDVIWYRGGTKAWTEAGFQLKKPEGINW